MVNLFRSRTFRTAILGSAVGWLVLGLGCGRYGLSIEIWIDDEGREITVHRNGDEWTGYWVEPQVCPVNGIERPRERFRLRVDEQGEGIGTLAICRYGFENCANGPATARFEAQVAVDRIEGTVIDEECRDYRGTEVIRRLRCAARRPTDYLSSTTPLEWKEDSSRVDSGILVFRAPVPDRTPGGLQVWGIATVGGEVTLVAPTGVRLRASDGELHYGFEPGGELLVHVGEEVSPGNRLVRLAPSESGQGRIFELQVLGFTPDLDPTDPHCVRGESGPVMSRRGENG